MLCRQYKKAYSLYFLKYEEVIEELSPSLQCQFEDIAEDLIWQSQTEELFSCQRQS